MVLSDILSAVPISLFEQTYDNIEYVFVNDCTPDLSVEVLSKVMMNYPIRMSSVHVVNHTRNKGLAAARNTALDWRTVFFKTRVEDMPNYQGNAVINYTSHEQPYTRVIEHKHFEMFGQAVYDCPKML